MIKKWEFVKTGCIDFCKTVEQLTFPSPKGHAGHIEQWAEYVKTHRDWKKIHTAFINGEFEKYNVWLKRLLEMPGSRSMIIEMYSIKNLEGCKGLLSKARD